MPLFLLLLALVQCCQCSTADDSLSILQSLYRTTGGYQWLKADGWQEHENFCSFHGVRCINGYVRCGIVSRIIVMGNSQIDLSLNRLIGEIPSLVGLDNVTSIDFSYNQLNGNISRNLFLLPSLESLNIEGNQLSGSLIIPDLYNNVHRLQKLNVAGNQLSGRLDSFGTLERGAMTYLDLSYNMFSGGIEQLMKHERLEYLYINDNQLTGTIPPEINDLTRLIELNCGNNLFSGDIPSMSQLSQIEMIDLSQNLLKSSKLDEFSALYNLTNLILKSNLIEADSLEALTTCTSLQVLSLKGNQITSTLPSNIQRCTQLQALILSDNEISGEIPSTIGALSQLSVLDLARNNMQGVLPSDIYHLSDLSYLDLSDNSFCGDTPTRMDTMNGIHYMNISFNQFNSSLLLIPSSLIIFDASFNRISQVLPPIPPQLSFLSVMGNHIEGPLPSTLYLSSVEIIDVLSHRLSWLDSLTYLNLSNNHFFGNIPFNLGGLINLESIDVSHNELMGTIPSTLGYLSNLKQLDISDNRITGPIPEQFMWREMTFLDMSNNEISSTIPSSIRFFNSSMTERTNQFLSLAHNHFDGEASWLGDIVNLEVIDLSVNQMVGPLVFLSNCVFLQCVNASFNNFYGTLPTRFSTGLVVLDVRYNQLMGTLNAVSSLIQLSYLDVGHNLFTGSLPHTGNLSVIRFDYNQLNMIDDFVLSPDISCNGSHNPLLCPLPWSIYIQCDLFCRINDNTSVSFRVKSGQEIERSLSSILNISMDRITADSRGEVTITAPIGSYINEGSAAYALDQLKQMQLNNDTQLVGSGIVVMDDPSMGGAVLAFIITLLCLFRRHRKKKTERSRVGQLRLQARTYRVQSICGKELEGLILDNVRVDDLQLGSGYFGQVFRGMWNGTVVALKKMRNEANDGQQRWKDEIVLLSKLNHPNIIRLLGIHMIDKHIYMVIEYAFHGSLDKYLQNRENMDALSNNMLVVMCWDVVKGMDLATRNLLVDKSLHIKITDFGMSRRDELYIQSVPDRAAPTPFRWTAPEVLLTGVATTKSDVWSYSIVIWEIFSAARIPYPELNNREVVEGVTHKGLRLSQPYRCPDDLFEIMKDCWQEDPQQRPSFNDIYNRMLSKYERILGNERYVPTASTSLASHAPAIETAEENQELKNPFCQDDNYDYDTKSEIEMFNRERSNTLIRYGNNRGSARNSEPANKAQPPSIRLVDKRYDERCPVLQKGRASAGAPFERVPLFIRLLTSSRQPDDFFLASNSKMPLDLGDFECALCFRLFCKPVTTPCGHTFCRCILLAIKYNSSCPLCRAKIESLRGSFSVNITVLNLVQKYFKEEYLARALWVERRHA
ncbi:LRR receptor-like serine/threonine-protein kinase FLS2-like [Planoprotostelium fungivorum]|uniref:LRR receptor-like serine/threonine-protein kinase FLS2-like n=1 Tax=Planoprotostelium fungivorum TaxID=1890364 RepID=A0A2P6MY30_9EUKA|nr:LRR receptor-like serine/threonine-protein kinase FLS2-like [Planoprotostelium fungivorum]